MRVAAIAAVVAFPFATHQAPALARVPTTLELDVRARSTGNDRAAAAGLATALLSRSWAAQIVRVRVDRAGKHAVAGIVLSGVKLKRRVDPDGFQREANAIVDEALRASNVEEIDLWTTVPLDAGVGAVTSGDLARPTSRTVFTLTVRRERRRDRTAYWDPGWRRELAASGEGR